MKFRTSLHPAMIAALMMLPLYGGCTGEAEDSHRDDHEQLQGDHHADGGPHGGHVFDLGRSGKYHAELVEDDEAENVSIYILDGDLKETTIDAETIAFLVTAGGATQTFDLPAANAAEGKASQFVAADSQLFHMLHDHGEVEGKLRVSIDGTPYLGEFDHHGDHARHDDDHEHGDHDH